MEIDQDVIVSDAGKAAIVDAVYKRGALSVLSDMFKDLNMLVNTRLGSHESFKNLELPFAASVETFNDNRDSFKLPSL